MGDRCQGELVWEPMSGELPLTYLPSYSLLLSLYIPILLSSFSTSLLVVSIDCDRYGHSHVM
jgi:hypothetical protein